MTEIELNFKDYLDERFQVIAETQAEIKQDIKEIKTELKDIRECKHCKNEAEFRNNFKYQWIAITLLGSCLAFLVSNYFISKPDSLSAKVPQLQSK